MGDLILLELKRDKTPREITAQALDYASWMKDLTNEEITEMADQYLKTDGPLNTAFSAKFNEPLPEILNENHKMLIVGSQIDSHSERIIKYLSETYGVNINAVTFDFYKDDGQEYLARNFLLEPEEVVANQSKKSRGKRKPPLSIDDYMDYSEKNGFGGLFSEVLDFMTTIFDSRMPTLSTISFIGIMEGRRNTILNIEPFESNDKDGISFYFYVERFCEYFGVKSEELYEVFATKLTEDSKWNVDNAIYRGFVKSPEQIQHIVERIGT
ncbi:MAG: hypothetical protein HN368_02160 [Spirochaetales bacterium]|nr:hypothetical protein [Spirochaetales bacterium]